MLGTRVVIRPTEAGTNVNCVKCREKISFVAKKRGRHVIANVYVSDEDRALKPREGPALAPGTGGTWDRVEHFHAFCYEEAGEPYGTPAAGEWQPEMRNERRHRAGTG
jgi:hypothetical protein